MHRGTRCGDASVLRSASTPARRGQRPASRPSTAGLLDHVRPVTDTRAPASDSGDCQPHPSLNYYWQLCAVYASTRAFAGRTEHEPRWRCLWDACGPGRVRLRLGLLTGFACGLGPGHWIQPSTTRRRVHVTLPELAHGGHEVAERRHEAVPRRRDRIVPSPAVDEHRPPWYTKIGANSHRDAIANTGDAEELMLGPIAAVSRVPWVHLGHEIRASRNAAASAITRGRTNRR